MMKKATYKGYEVWSDGTILSKRFSKPMSAGVATNGYRYVPISFKGVEKRTAVHRIIAETFIPNPDGKPIVNHKDGNKLNNSIDNLEWSTYSENLKHA